MGKHFAAAPEEAPSKGAVAPLSVLDDKDLPSSHQKGVHQAASNPYKDSGTGGKPRKKNVLSNILIIVGVGLLIAAGVIFWHIRSNYDFQRNNNDELASAADVTYDDDTGAPQIDWDALIAINDDVVGWVEVEGTEMSYPVYQGETNDTYLHTTATGEWSIGGQVFMDCENTAPGMVDSQTLVYGHHLNDGQMFAPLDDLKEQANFDKVDTVWYVTRDNVAWEMEPLLLYIIKSDYDDDLRTFEFASKDEFHEYLDKMLDKAVAQRSDAAQIIGSTDHVLTLVTCNYDFGHGRAVLLCVPKSEAQAASAESGA